MNKKGFTLIELIVTIALLAVIAVVSFVSITGVIKESRNKDCKNMETTIINAAKSYVSDYRYDNNVNKEWLCNNETTNDIKNFTAQVLIDNHYLTKELENPYTKEELNEEEIKITVDLDTSCKPISIIVSDLPKNCQS